MSDDSATSFVSFYRGLSGTERSERFGALRADEQAVYWRTHRRRIEADRWLDEEAEAPEWLRPKPGQMPIPTGGRRGPATRRGHPPA
jgi:hypothetical protein